MPTDIVLNTVKNESRVDSRIVAGWLEIQHESVMASMHKHDEALAEHGKLRFKTEPLISGQKEKFALLNEDQCFFVLSLSRNTPKVVHLKSAMVKAFGAARRAIADRERYLIEYHPLHDAIKVMAATNNTEQKWQHINYNKLINKVFEIEPGTRQELDAHKLALVIGAQAMCKDWVEAGIDMGLNHKELYKFIKRKLNEINLPLLPAE